MDEPDLTVFSLIR